MFFLIDDNIFPPVSLPRCSCGWSWWSQISTWAPFSSLKTSSVSSKWPPPRLLYRSATPSAPLWEEQTPAWRGFWSDFDFQMLEERICLPFLKEEAAAEKSGIYLWKIVCCAITEKSRKYFSSFSISCHWKYLKRATRESNSCQYFFLHILNILNIWGITIQLCLSYDIGALPNPLSNTSPCYVTSSTQISIMCRSDHFILRKSESDQKKNEKNHILSLQFLGLARLAKSALTVRLSSNGGEAGHLVHLGPSAQDVILT